MIEPPCPPCDIKNIPAEMLAVLACSFGVLVIVVIVALFQAREAFLSFRERRLREINRRIK